MTSAGLGAGRRHATLHIERAAWFTSTLAFVVGAAAVLSWGCSLAADLKQALQVADVTTGWFDAGVVEGTKNKLVPSLSFRLKNRSQHLVRSVQLNGVFRRAGEAEEWASAFVRGIGSAGLPPGQTTPPIVLRSQLGYTGTEPRVQMLQNREFVDAKVELFAKSGSAQWVKLGEYRIQRQLLTHYGE